MRLQEAKAAEEASRREELTLLWKQQVEANQKIAALYSTDAEYAAQAPETILG